MNGETLAEALADLSWRGRQASPAHAEALERFALRWLTARLDDDRTRNAVACVLDESGWEQNPDDLSWARVYRPGPKTDAALAIVKTALGAAGPRIGARVDVPLRVVRPAGGGS